MPTDMGTIYTLTYDLGDAHQRGVAGKFGALKWGIREVLDKGLPGLEKHIFKDEAIAHLEVIISSHMCFQRDQRRITLEQLGKLQELPGYISEDHKPILHWT